MPSLLCKRMAARRPPFGKVKTVFALLVCLAQFFLPSFAILFAEIQLHAMILSLSVFAFIVCRIVPGSRTGAT